MQLPSFTRVSDSKIDSSQCPLSDRLFTSQCPVFDHPAQTRICQKLVRQYDMGNGNTCPSLRGITDWVVMFHQLSFEGSRSAPKTSSVGIKRRRIVGFAKQ